MLIHKLYILYLYRAHREEVTRRLTAVAWELGLKLGRRDVTEEECKMDGKFFSFF